MDIDQVQWWIALVSFTVTLLLRATGGEWTFCAFLTLVTVGLMGA